MGYERVHVFITGGRHFLTHVFGYGGRALSRRACLRLEEVGLASVACSATGRDLNLGVFVWIRR